MRTTRSIAAVAALALLATACGGGLFGSGNSMVEVSATFDDVSDLVAEHSVRYNDVTVGSVESITLTDDHRATVTMAVDRDEMIPAGVRAELAKTSVLGERYIALVPTADGAECCLEDGTVITDTAVRDDLEDLVSTGSDLLVSVGADAVNTAIRTGAQAFGGRSQLIGGFIEDVNALLSTLNANSDDVVALIDALDAVTAAYAPNAPENAAVLADLREAAAALQDQDDLLLDTLEDVTVLSGEATAFLAEHQDELHNLIRRLRKVLEEVEEADGDVQELLEIAPVWLPILRRAAFDMDNTERLTETQVWLDTIVCGSNDTPGDPSRQCTFETEE